MHMQTFLVCFACKAPADAHCLGQPYLLPRPNQLPSLSLCTGREWALTAAGERAPGWLRASERPWYGGAAGAGP